VRVLLDTCAVSELRLPAGNPALRAALADIDDNDVFVSVLTLGEIAKGIAPLRESRRKRELAAWLSGLERQYADRILGVDRAIAVAWGNLIARAQQQGVTLPAVDALIAAMALHHGLRVITRNSRQFAASGVQVIDPWQ